MAAKKLHSSKKPSNDKKTSKKGKKGQKSKTFQDKCYDGDRYFGFLHRKGTHAVSLMEDGNCLFASLSDQLYGDLGRSYATVRRQVVNQIRKDKETFLEPIVMSDAGMRLAEEGKEDIFEAYLEEMAENYTWGDAVVIRAFADANDVDIVVFMADPGAVPTRFLCSNQKAKHKRTLYIAFHTIDAVSLDEEEDAHYWSVRKVGVDVGPTGLSNDLDK